MMIFPPPNDENENEDDDNPDKEEDLWLEISKSITPLKDRDQYSKNDIPPAEKPKKAVKETPEPAKQKKAPEQSPPPPSPAQSSREIDRRSLQRLKRGSYTIEGRIDLHGKTQIEARDALISFLQASYGQGKRCVLVITGKGGRRTRPDDTDFSSSTGIGILRSKLPEWLNDSAVRDIVLKHVPAQPKDGGDGAFYILLRRKR